MKRITTTVAMALCILSGAAIAQGQAQAPRSAPAPQQAAARDIDPNTLANSALQILQAIDRDQAGVLWDNASAVTKRTARRDEFVGHVGKTRKPLGAANSRNWIAVRRELVTDGGQLPAGLYASIEFSSQFQSKRLAKELVSLRRDEDGMWRFSGYVIQ
ncbi:DUF4019 domain-containing protein [Lysobacter capsici]|uniref:DUF4019 domain-containing protein n=1 Tax=Lysobacter capsici TaxID=435897 RepID=UPI001785276F|nr:DUF4019 domain-containing protein [Lysobacter capsici]UOF14403.1 DUF4019 domain-containing protein [Lysobacter capsici]